MMNQLDIAKLLKEQNNQSNYLLIQISLMKEILKEIRRKT